MLVMFKYNEENIDKTVQINNSIAKDRKKIINVGVIGAGSFAKSVHLPNLKELKKYYRIHSVASRTGNNAKFVAEQYGARYASTDYTKVINDPEVDAIIITTRHHLHGSLALKL